MYTHACAHVYMHVYLYISACAHTHTNIYRCTHVCQCACLRQIDCVCVCVCAFMCVHIHTWNICINIMSWMYDSISAFWGVCQSACTCACVYILCACARTCLCMCLFASFCFWCWLTSWSGPLQPSLVSPVGLPPVSWATVCMYACVSVGSEENTSYWCWDAGDGVREKGGGVEAI